MTDAHSYKLGAASRWFSYIGISMCVALGGLAWVGLVRGSSAAQRDQTQVIKSAAVEVPQGPEVLGMWGRYDAPVVMVEYSDYTCKSCAEFARTEWPRILREFVDTQRLLYIHVPLALDTRPMAVEAAAAAVCAGEQMKYWQMHARLFSTAPFLESNVVRAHAVSLDLDMTTFDACLVASGAARLEAARQRASSAGIAATPAYLIGRQQGAGKPLNATLLLGPTTYAAVVEVLESVLD